MITFDSDGLRNLRLSRGLEQRRLAKDTGVDNATIRRIENKGISETSTFSVAQLIRIVDYLGVDMNYLFHVSGPESPDPMPLDDTQLLGATLLELGKSTRTRAVCEVLGWDSTKTHKVADALNDLLRPAGLHLRHNRGVLRLRPLDTRHQGYADNLRDHPLARVSHRVVNEPRAKLIYRLEHKPDSNHFATEDSILSLAVLFRFGIVEQNNRGIFVVADQVLHSLYPEGFSRDSLDANPETPVGLLPVD